MCMRSSLPMCTTTQHQARQVCILVSSSLRRWAWSALCISFTQIVLRWEKSMRLVSTSSLVVKALLPWVAPQHKEGNANDRRQGILQASQRRCAAIYLIQGLKPMHFIASLALHSPQEISDSLTCVRCQKESIKQELNLPWPNVSTIAKKTKLEQRLAILPC